MKPNEIKLYKLYESKSEQYYQAGFSLTRYGKTWNNLGHLKNAIRAASPLSENASEAIVLEFSSEGIKEIGFLKDIVSEMKDVPSK